MAAYVVDGWSAFFAAQAGAAAALAGLLFVGLSLNLDRILHGQWLPGRAAETLALLLLVLIVSSVALVPEQPSRLLGGELLLVSGGTWTFTVLGQVRQRVRGDTQRHQLVRIGLCQAATLPFVIAGISLLAQTGGGLYWTVLGVVGTYLAGVLNAWVLLVEIQR